MTQLPPKAPKISDVIRSRVLEAKTNNAMFANESISNFIREGELELLKDEVAEAAGALLNALLIDQENDHNTQETAHRIAKMYVDEVMMGRFYPAPKMTSFPNAKKLDEQYVVGPIKFRSMCSHHFAPIIGEAWVGVIPGDKVIGLSKFNRLTHWIMSRPQIQEEAIMQLADLLEKELNPKGLAIIVRADHMCMQWRGVKDDSQMTNCVVRGLFMHNPNAKSEFLALVKGMGF